MTTDPKIRRRPDGSIDTGWYMARGRARRSETAHGMIAPRPAPAPAATRRPLFSLAALLALVPFLGNQG